jgi:amino acid transporter
VLKISLRRYIAELIVKPYVPGVAASIAIYSIMKLRMPSSWIDIVIYGMATFGFYFISFYLFSLNKSEKSRILDAVKQRVLRVAGEEKPSGETTVN